MSTKNAENRGAEAKSAKKRDWNEYLYKLTTAEITATMCILDVLPDSEFVMPDNQFCFDVFIDKKYVGTVWFADQATGRPLTKEEICDQVKEIAKRVQRGDEKRRD